MFASVPMVSECCWEGVDLFDIVRIFLEATFRKILEVVLQMLVDNIRWWQMMS